MAQEELEDYLQAQEQGHLDSSGQFTVDLQAMAAKWARYQTSEPALFLLKGVQAAVASGAAKVQIKLGRASVSLSFSPEKQPEIAAEDLLSEKQFELSWIRYLSVGLRNAFSQHPQQIQLVWRGQRHHWARSDYRVEGETSGEEVAIALSRPVEHWWNYLLPSGWHAHLHVEVAWRCAFCPIPVSLDGRLVNHGDPDRLPFMHFPKVFGAPFEGAWSSYRWLSDRAWLSPQGGFCVAPPVVRQPFLTRYGISGHSAAGVEDYPRLLSSWLYTSELETIAVRSVEFDSFKRGSDAKVVEKALKDPATLSLGYLYWANKESIKEKATVIEDMARFLFLDLPCSWHPGNWSSLPAPCMRASRWAGVRFFPQQESRLLYLQDGILLNPVALKTRFAGTTGLLARSDIATDLSHLEPIRDNLFESDAAWLLAQEKELALSVLGAVVDVREAERRRIPQSARDFWRNELRS